MKRTLYLLLAVALLLCWLPLGAAAAAREVTLSAGDSLDSALEEVADGGTIRVNGTVSVSSVAGHGKAVTITGGTLEFTQNTVLLGDHITFENMTLTFPSGATVYAGGCKVTVGTGVVLTNPITIYGGANGGTVASTELTLLSGTYTAIYGGSRGGTVTGDTHLTVGGTVNSTIDETNHSGSNNVYGGNYGGSIGGTAYTVLTGEAKTHYLYGGSRGGGTITGGTNVTVSGGKMMNASGGASGGTHNGNVKMTITGGTIEQVFGGSTGGAMTGDVELNVLGGTITRRIYGGCYNEVVRDGLSFVWKSTNYVTGTIVLTIGGGASITFTYSENDKAIYAHSRQKTLSDTEVSHLVFADATAYSTYKNSVKAQDFAMQLIMGSTSAADYTHYRTYSASGGVITQSCICGGCAATATLSATDAVYTGNAIESAQVAYSENWHGGTLPVTYENHVSAGSATASITKDGTTATVHFTIGNADQAAPALDHTDETVKGKADGRISGLTTVMELSTDGVTYQPVTDADPELAAGTYYVRYAAKTNYNASPATVVTIAAGRMLRVTFADEDGTVLSAAGYAYGDTVTPPADPAKAADNTYTYTFAGWDKEVTACTEDATYTATYEKKYAEFAGGTGTEEDPYLIGTKIHLNNVRNYLDACYRMLNDIIISDEDYQQGGAFYNEGTGWEPIGGNDAFTGVFDGNGFSVENLVIKLDCANTTSAGLFGVNDGTILNLTIGSGSISVVEDTNRISVGAVVGTNKGTVDNCHNRIPVYVLSTTFTSRIARAGGIVGYNYAEHETVIVRNCSNSGDISAYAVDNYAYSGGIVGESFANRIYTDRETVVIIEKCYNSGAICSGAQYSYSGGIVGENTQNYTKDAIVRKCGNIGRVIAGQIYESGGHAGGIAGFNGGSISECYNTADVTAYLTDSFNSAYAGGIAGSNSSPNSGAANSIENCFNIGNITAIEQASFGNYAYAGGITGCQSFSTDYPGKTSHCYNLGLVTSNQEEFGPITSVINGGTVEECYHLDNMQSVFDTETSCSQSEMMQMETFVGFDFANIWTMDGNSDYPYPELKEAKLQEELVSVEIVSMPNKQTYFVNEGTLDLTGGKISLNYNTTRTELMDMTAEMARGFEGSVAGKQTITIRVDGLEVAFEIEVKFATITFVNEDGTVLQENLYAYGDEVTAPADPAKAADNIYTYTFTGWDREVTDCVGDATYTAKYTSAYIDYTVEFKDWNGTVLSTQTYHYGETVTPPADPAKATDHIGSYTFAGWDREVSNCIADATYTAVYTVTYIDYAVKFLDEDGTVLSEQICHWGDRVTVPADPTKEADNTYTYTFAGWDKEVVNCAGEAIYTATYTSAYIDYMVVFEDWNGTVLSSNTYHYGDKVTAPADPTKEADNTYTYTFAGWDKEVVDCAGDATYTATYKSTYIDYTVKFLNADGSTISEKTYHYGDEVTAPADPAAPAGYAFQGWDKEVTSCHADAVYTATFAQAYILGDLNQDTKVNNKDVEYLLWHTLFPEKYPIVGEADFNGDGSINNKDVEYLLWHTLFPKEYPLIPKKKED